LLAASACTQDPAAVAVDPAPAPATVTAEDAQARAEATAAFPTLQVTTLDGDAYDLSERRGRWVVVNFWATWCAPCIKEMPELSDLDAANEHIEVIGLAYEEIDVAAMREFLEKRPVVYPIALIDVYAPPADFATPRGLPMTYLIAPDGTVAKQFLGPVTAVQIESVIAEADVAAVNPSG
jgi:thiol-disulfide isomerase/thioredoxin